MKVLVSGTRRGLNEDILKRSLEYVPVSQDGYTLIHGDCSGIDKQMAKLCDERGWRIEPYPADWHTQGDTGGPIRNTFVVNLNPDFGIFLPDIKSRGTYDCLNKFRAKGKRGVCYLPKTNTFSTF